MPKPKIDLQKILFSHIHQAILESSSRGETATSLGVISETLTCYLGNLRHQGKALSWKTLKKLPVAELQKLYGDKYNQPWPAEKIDLQKRPFSEIHQAILKSSNRAQAARSLGVRSGTLACYLSKLRYQGKALSWETLQKLSASELQKDCDDKYNQPWPAVKIDLQARPFSEIHQAILESSNKAAAATSLGISAPTLVSYLSQFQLSWAALKNLSVAELQNVHGDKYNRPWSVVKIDLQARPFSEIHQAVLKSSSRGETATSLGVVSETLAYYLSNLRHQGKTLSWEALKELSAAELQNVHGDKYKQPWPAEKIDLQARPFSEIHEVILDSSSEMAAATSLGVDAPTLTRYLSNLRYQGKALSWDTLKKLSATELQNNCRDKYKQPWPAVKIALQERPFSEIHQAILKSSSETAAAGSLGFKQETFTRYLSNLRYQGKALSWSTLKKLSVEKLQKDCGDKYNQPWLPVKIDLETRPFSEIHEAILKSSSETAAAKRLGMFASTLAGYLSQLRHHSVELSWSVLKELSAADLKETYEDMYLEPWPVGGKGKLREFSFSYIHQTILKSSNEVRAAISLRVGPVTLGCYLSNLRHQGKALSWGTLKELPVAELEKLYGDKYNQPWLPVKFDLETRPFSEIHEAILKSSSGTEAAKSLGVQPPTLARYLSQFQYQGNTLSWAALKKLSVAELQESPVSTLPSHKTNLYQFFGETALQSGEKSPKRLKTPTSTP